MNIFKNLRQIFLLALITLGCNQSLAMDIPNKYHYNNYYTIITSFADFYADFVKNNLVNSEIKQLLDNNLPASLEHINEFEWLPGYIVKNVTPLPRIIGSVLIRQYAHENHLDAVSAPFKKGYSRHVNSHNREYLIAQKIEKINKPFSLKQTQQLYAVFKATCFTDIHSENIYNTPEGIAYIIDTDSGSFEPHSQKIEEYILWRLYNCLYIEKSAKEWLENKLSSNSLSAKL